MTEVIIDPHVLGAILLVGLAAFVALIGAALP